jgi:hypothetical protein
MPHKPKGGFTHGGPRPGAGAPRTVIKLRKGQTLELVPAGGTTGSQTFTIVGIEEDAIWLRSNDPTASQEPIRITIGDTAE